MPPKEFFNTLQRYRTLPVKHWRPSTILVTWQDEAAARVLMSAAEVQAAAANGELVIEEPGMVVNMPFLTWPGGYR